MQRDKNVTNSMSYGLKKLCRRFNHVILVRILGVSAYTEIWVTPRPKNGSPSQVKDLLHTYVYIHVYVYIYVYRHRPIYILYIYTSDLMIATRLETLR